MQTLSPPNAGRPFPDHAAPGAAGKTMSDIITGNLLVTRPRCLCM